MSIQSKLKIVSASLLIPVIFTACSTDSLTDSLSSDIYHTAGAAGLLNVDNKQVYLYDSKTQVYSDNTVSIENASDHITIQDNLTKPTMSLSLSSDLKTITNIDYTNDDGIKFDKLEAAYSCYFVTSSDEIASGLETNGIDNYEIKTYQCKIEDGSLTNSQNDSVNISESYINIQETYYKIDLLDVL